MLLSIHCMTCIMVVTVCLYALLLCIAKYRPHRSQEMPAVPHTCSAPCYFGSLIKVGYNFRTRTDRPDRNNTLDRGLCGPSESCYSYFRPLYRLVCTRLALSVLRAKPYTSLASLKQRPSLGNITVFYPSW